MAEEKQEVKQSRPQTEKKNQTIIVNKIIIKIEIKIVLIDIVAQLHL